MDRRHRTSRKRFAIHNRSIELVLAVVIKNRTLARVEKRRVFENPDGNLDGIETRFTILKSLVSGHHGFLKFRPIPFFLIRCHRALRNYARSAVDNKTKPGILRPLKLFDLGHRTLLGERGQRHCGYGYH